MLFLNGCQKAVVAQKQANTLEQGKQNTTCEL